MKTMKLENNLWKYLNNKRLMLVISITVVLIANIQVLFSFFWGDDFLHFYQIANWNPFEFIFLPFGNQFFPFRQLIYYGLFKIFGLNSLVYFSIVLLTHACSAYLLYKIILLLTDRPSLAAAGSMMWGIYPGNYSSLAYFPSYGQILTSLFFLLFLYDLIRIEKGEISFSKIVAIRWSFYAFLMATSYGTGLAIACLSPLIIVIILWKVDQKWKMAASMLPVIAMILVLFILKDSIYHYFSGEVHHSTPIALDVAFRHYKVILEMFIRMCVYSIYTMAALPMFLLTHQPSSAPQYPLHAFFISIPVAILFITVFFHSKEYKRQYLVFSMVFLGLIGLHAYGRAVFYQVFGIPASTASMTFRYYYVVYIPIVFIMSLMINDLLDIFPQISKAVISFVLLVIAISIYPSMNLAKVIDPFNTAAKEKFLYYETISDIEKTIKACPEGSSVFIDNTMKNLFSIFLPSGTDFPGKAAVFAIRYPNNTVEDRRVYFVEKDCRVAKENLAKKNWRISSLMVSACDLKK